MRSKSFTLFCTILIAVALLNACKGPDGPAGPQGTVGLQGAQGATGSKGDPGNANVVYSDWKTINWTVSGLTNGYYYLSSPTTTNALFTKDAINTAAIYTYIKYNTYVETSVPLKYQLVERITSDPYANHFFKVPGRTDAGFYDYGYVNIAQGNIGENYYAPIAYFMTSTLGTDIPELKNLTPAAVRNLISTLPQFRQVVVYGGVKTGRLASVNWKNYTEVKEALGLID